MISEKRTRHRFDDKNIVNIKVKRSAETVELSQQTLFCFSRDISACGLSFTAHFPPVVGAVLNLSVAFTTPLRTARNLTGRVMWVQRIPNGTQHVVGVDLSDTDLENLNNWKKLVIERVTSK
ncbi:MAG: PilZ domain-containing protein [bacterium]